MRHSQDLDAFNHDFGDRLVLAVGGVDHHIHVVARQGKTSHTHDFIDFDGDRALAIAEHRRQPTFFASGGEFAAQQRLTAQHRHVDHTVQRIVQLGERIFDRRRLGPLDGFQHIGHQLRAHLQVALGHNHLQGGRGPLLFEPAGCINSSRQAQCEGQQQHPQGTDIFHGCIPCKVMKSQRVGQVFSRWTAVPAPIAIAYGTRVRPTGSAVGVVRWPC